MSSRTTLLRRVAATTTALGVAAAGAVTLAAVPANAAQKKVETPFAYKGSAFGTRVVAGDKSVGSVGSGRTAWAVQSCTRLAPVTKANKILGTKVSQDSMIEVGLVTSNTGSYRRPARKLYGSRSVSKVSDIVLGDPQGAHLSIGSLTTTANAFNRRGKFGARTNIKLLGLGIELTEPVPSSGPLKDLVDAINAGKDQVATSILGAAGEIAIPGVGTIYLDGKERTTVRKSRATANAFGIRVELEGNESRATIGRAWSGIYGNVPAGAFNGHAYGFQVRAADGLLATGRNVLQPLPCPGTNGRWISESLAGGGNPAVAKVAGAKASTYGLQRANRSAVGRAKAEIASADLGGGELVVSGIKGQVNIVQSRKGRITRRSIDGTTIGSIKAGRDTYAVPNPGQALEIPGVAKVEHAVTSRQKRSVRVVALRVTLLDGTGAVVDLGVAKVRLSR